MISTKLITEMAQDAYDQAWYDRARRLQMFYSGDYDPTKDLDKQPLPITAPTTCSFWRDYPDTSVSKTTPGVHNAAMVASRVMVQGIVYAMPDFVVDISHPLTKAYNQAWLKKRWMMGRWAGKFLEMGMVGYEPCGISFAQVGPVDHGVHPDGSPRRYIDITVISPVDVIWDAVNKSPSDWEMFIVRKRYSRARFFSRWANLIGADECERLWGMYSRSAREFAGRDRGISDSTSYAMSIYEFEFWTKDSHAIVLGHIEDGLILGWSNEQMRWEVGEDGKVEVHDNPFGVIPIIPWWDNFSATGRRPEGKGRSVFNVVAQSNKLERRLNEIVENSAPITAISTYQMQDKEFIKFIQQKNPVSEWGAPILTQHPKVAEVITRIPGAEISQTHLLALNRMDQHIAGVTGTSDAERGLFMARPGERVSAYEVKMQAQQGGVQRRHMATRFADFLATLAMTVRAVGSIYDTFRDDLIVDGYLFEGEIFDARDHISEDAFVHVSEDSLLELGSEAMRQKAIEEFAQLHVPFMQMVNPATGMPVVDPVASYNRIASMYGIADPSSLTMQAAAPASPMQAAGMTPDEASMSMLAEMAHNTAGKGNAIEPRS